MDPAGLRFDQHGAARHDRAALRMLDGLEAALAACPTEQPGVRLHGNQALRHLLCLDEPAGRIAAHLIGPAARPVRAVLFDKTPGTNWSLGWHQDRTVVVRERHTVPGYGPWTIKTGLQHVEPPFAVIEEMVTLRIHLDDVPRDNAPLLVSPGSHRLGRIRESEIATTVGRLGIVECLAVRGDIWVYATPVLHASAVRQDMPADECSR